MDPKASAKAKRSHTQQGRKSHPTPSAIAQKKKAAQGVSEEKVRRPRSQTLLSNWDRYDDGKEEDKSADDTKVAEGEIAPKSKGADFAYLIEQARSQQDKTKAPDAAESLSFFDELTLDFKQGVSSIHTVRGKNILSRCEDDNFVVEDDLTPSFEVPFLNLDLHALAAQLSKMKLSERLFIEPDLLPDDLCPDESKGSSSCPRSETIGVIHVGQNLDAHHSLPCSSPAKDVHVQTEDQKNVFPHSGSSLTYPDHGNVQGVAGEAEESLASKSKSSALKVGEAEAELDLLLESLRETNLSGSIQGDLFDKKPASQVSFHDSTPTNRKSNATGLINRKQPIEAELDNLLDSPKETSLFGSIPGSLLDNSSKFKAQSSNSLYPTHQQSIIRDQISVTSTATTSIDDSIDILLAETSPIPKIQKHVSFADPQLGPNRPPPHSGSSSIDDLLAVTSLSQVQKSTARSNEAASSSNHSFNLGLRDTTGDFDSWIDSF